VREFRKSATLRQTGAFIVSRPSVNRENQEEEMEVDKLLQSEVRVVNIGLRQFARDLAACHVPVVHVDWSPPAVHDPKLADLLAKLGG
jgi:hypothetical protein